MGDALKTLSSAVLKQAALLLTIALLSLGGALLFYAIEGGEEAAVKSDIIGVKTELIKKLVEKSGLGKAKAAKEFQKEANEAFEDFEETLLEAYTSGGLATETKESVWSLTGSLFYVGTVFTTVGYGNIYPTTTLGKLLTIVYASVTIPLVLIFLDVLGKLFTRCLKAFPESVRVFYYSDVGKILRGAPGVSALEEKLGWPKQREDCQGKPLMQLMDEALAKSDEEFDLPLLPAIGVLVAYCALGATMYSLWEDLNFVDAFYFVFITISTIGFGDVLPEYPLMMIVTSLYVFIGLGVCSMVINVIMEVLHQQMQIALMSRPTSKEPQLISLDEVVQPISKECVAAESAPEEPPSVVKSSFVEPVLNTTAPIIEEPLVVEPSLEVTALLLEEPTAVEPPLEVVETVLEEPAAVEPPPEFFAPVLEEPASVEPALEVAALLLQETTVVEAPILEEPVAVEPAVEVAASLLEQIPAVETPLEVVVPVLEESTAVEVVVPVLEEPAPIEPALEVAASLLEEPTAVEPPFEVVAPVLEVTTAVEPALEAGAPLLEETTAAEPVLVVVAPVVEELISIGLPLEVEAPLLVELPAVEDPFEIVAPAFEDSAALSLSCIELPLEVEPPVLDEPVAVEAPLETPVAVLDESAALESSFEVPESVSELAVSKLSDEPVSEVSQPISETPAPAVVVEEPSDVESAEKIANVILKAVENMDKNLAVLEKSAIVASAPATEEPLLLSSLEPQEATLSESAHSPAGPDILDGISDTSSPVEVELKNDEAVVVTSREKAPEAQVETISERFAADAERAETTLSEAASILSDIDSILEALEPSGLDPAMMEEALLEDEEFQRTVLQPVRVYDIGEEKGSHEPSEKSQN